MASFKRRETFLRRFIWLKKGKTMKQKTKPERIYSIFKNEIDELIKSEREKIIKEIWSDTFLSDEDKKRLTEKLEETELNRRENNGLLSLWKTKQKRII